MSRGFWSHLHGALGSGLHGLCVSTLSSWTRVLAKDLGKRRITVDTILQSLTGTEKFYEEKSEQIMKMIEAWAPENGLSKQARRDCWRCLVSGVR